MYKSYYLTQATKPFLGAILLRSRELRLSWVDYGQQQSIHPGTLSLPSPVGWAESRREKTYGLR